MKLTEAKARSRGAGGQAGLWFSKSRRDYGALPETLRAVLATERGEGAQHDALRQEGVVDRVEHQGCVVTVFVVHMLGDRQYALGSAPVPVNRRRRASGGPLADFPLRQKRRWGRAAPLVL